MDNKHGQMNLVMRVIGLMIKQTALESFFMLMVISMKENGKMTKQMGKGHTLILTELGMKEIGRMISSMGLVLRLGLMVPSMKGIILKERKMGKENLILLMGLFIKESLE